MLVTKDTKEATHKFFAVADIDARAEAAYAANKQLFNSKQHTTKVELVDSILKDMFVGYATAYQTPRGATRVRAAHTEVKYYRVTLFAATSSVGPRPSVQAAHRQLQCTRNLEVDISVVDVIINTQETQDENQDKSFHC